jgi:hypothetical protein
MGALNTPVTTESRMGYHNQSIELLIPDRRESRRYFCIDTALHSLQNMLA